PLTLYGAAWVAPPGSGLPTGPVNYYIDNVFVTSLNISPGVNYAALTLSNLPIGKHTVVTSYGGDGNFLSSVSPAITVTVQDPTGATQLFTVVSAPSGVTAGTPFSIFAAAFDANGNRVNAFTNRPA